MIKICSHYYFFILISPILVLSFFLFLFLTHLNILSYSHQTLPPPKLLTFLIGFILILPTLIVWFFSLYTNIHLYTLIWLEVNIVCRWRQLNKFSSKTFLSKPFVQELQQQWYLTSCFYITMTCTVNILVTINWLNLT